MGYTSVRDIQGAVNAAAALARVREGEAPPAGGADDMSRRLPLLVDQVMAEAGVCESRVAERALAQARGDIARAVSLIRAWAATLPRLPAARVEAAELEPVRRISPGFRKPPGGQFLGPSLDYETRLLDLGPDGAESRLDAAVAPEGGNGHRPHHDPLRLVRAVAGIEAEGLVAPSSPAAVARDRTRHAGEATQGRGALLQILARAETGALTAMAYAGQRSFAARFDPTLVELRVGNLPVRLQHPETGGTVTVGRVAVTAAEVVLYRVHDGAVDFRFTVGFAATFGRVERRAIAAAMLDANCARADEHPGTGRAPSDDPEFLSLVLDGQDSSGFVEHLKLPHHVTFTSDLDRVRQASSMGEDQTP